MKRKRVVIHAGYHKTGTTSIQVVLTHARATLHAAGVLYPYAAVPPEFPYGHHHLPWSLMNDPPAGRGFDPAARDRLWHELRAEIDASPAPLVILSSEEFDRLSRPEIFALAEELRAYELIPVIFVRDHADLIESMYRTYIVYMGYSAPIARFAAEGAPRLDYAAMVRDWIAIAAPETAVVMSYEDEIIRADAVAAFLRVLDIAPAHAGGDGTTFVNTSVPAFVCEIIRSLRAQGADAAVVQRWIDEVRQFDFGSAANLAFACMPSELRAALRGRFDAERATLAADPIVAGRLRGSLVRPRACAEPLVIADPGPALRELRACWGESEAWHRVPHVKASLAG